MALDVEEGDVHDFEEEELEDESDLHDGDLETDDTIQEMMYAMCKGPRRRHRGLHRSYKETEKRVLEATRRQDARESTEKAYTQQTVQNYARGLIDDRETLENIREALGVTATYDLMLVNLLYEPARTHVLQQVVV